MSIWASHLLFWGIGLGAIALGTILARVLDDGRCELASEHEWIDGGYCDRCGASACRWCGGEGAVYASYRDRVEEGGRECTECDGTGVVR